MIRELLDLQSLDSYRKFLRIKRLPFYRFDGRTALVPDEYADVIGRETHGGNGWAWEPSPFLFDYQRDIAKLAIRKHKFCVFADCGLGKTLIFLEFAKYVSQVQRQCVLIVSPPMVISQTLAEAARWYPDLNIERIPSGSLNDWLCRGEAMIGITNYEAFNKPVERGRLGGLILDESSMLKSHYGKWGTGCLRLGRGLEWKLAGSGTPAPNDRIEYANHAVFMDAYPSVNSFLARFFVNRGQTAERWELKPHALKPFYRALSHWSIFLANPAVYGWTDNTEPLPPIIVHQHRVQMTDEQREASFDATGVLFHHNAGGIAKRSTAARIGKGSYRGKRIDTNKPEMIAALVKQWPNESTLIWCLYNDEEELIAETIPNAALITGSTPQSKRETIIADFKSGRCKVLISKPKILGFGLNLEHVTRMVFSGLQDSYESYYQAIKRANRYGSTQPLNVHIPFTDLEYPMIENVLRKAEMVQKDTEEQEAIFREYGYVAV